MFKQNLYMSIFFIFMLCLAYLVVFIEYPEAAEVAEPDRGSSVEDEEAADNRRTVAGEAYGFNEEVPIKVEVSLLKDEDKIVEIVTVEHAETDGISDPAFEKIPRAIIEAQSTDVDAVSGATETSKAIIEAVENAIRK